MQEDLKEVPLNNDSSANFFGKMKRYPFNGSSKYLIDKFFIIGYDYPTLNKILIKNDFDFTGKSTKTNNEDMVSEKIKLFTIPVPPSLINEISSDYSKEVLDIDLITEMIFPNEPSFYYTEVWLVNY